MALAHVQTVKAVGSGVTSVTSAGITTTTGNLLAAGCGSWQSAAQNLVVTDSNTNTWTENPSSPKDPTGGNTRIHQFYVPNATGGASHTFTATGNPVGYMSLFVSEFSGVALVSPLDTSAGAIGNSTAPSSGVTATRAQADELLVGMAGTNDGGNLTWTAGAGFTIPANGSHGIATEYVGAVEYQIVSAPGTDAAIFALSGGVPWAAIIGAYKMAGAGGVITEGASLQVVQSGGEECHVVHDASAVGVKIVLASANQITVTPAGGTAIKVTI